MICIVNTRSGNIMNLKNALDRVGVESFIAEKPDELDKASHILIPGVSAFGYCMDNINRLGFTDKLHREKENKPILGICVGMQLLMESSTEHGNHQGLGFIKGHVSKIKTDEKIPHMGWNTVKQVNKGKLFTDIPDESWFYFVHSFACHPEKLGSMVGETNYGENFCSIVEQDNICGFQFHPEKSHDMGLMLLRNFCRYYN